MGSIVTCGPTGLGGLPGLVVLRDGISFGTVVLWDGSSL